MSADDILKYISYFSSKLSPKKIFCMKFQSLFSGKNKKNVIILLSAESGHSMLSVNGIIISDYNSQFG